MKSFADFLVIFNGDVPKNSRSGKPWEDLPIFSPEAKFFTSFSDFDFGKNLIKSEKKGIWQYWMLGEIFGSRDLTCVENLNGHFLLIGYEQALRQWHVWTNRLGSYHCYYATDGKRAAIGTYFPSVGDAASAKQLDWEGLSSFFAFGFFAQDKTYFKDVKILHPASHYIFDEKGKKISESRYWNWRHNPDLKRSYQDTVAQFGETLEQIVNDQTASGRFALPISSGLDSRTVAAAVTRSTLSGSQGGADLHGRLWAYSYGYTDHSHEIAIASRIAMTRQIPFDRFVIPPYLFENLDLVFKSVEGFQDFTMTRQAAIADKVEERSDYLLAAHWGDVWMDAMGLTQAAERKTYTEVKILDHAMHKIQKRGSEWLLKNVCRPQLGRKDSEELLQQIVREELKKTEHIKDPDFRIKAFKTDQWSFRWTCASLRMFQPGAFPRLPFYDNRMVDFCCTVPTDFVRGRRLQIDYLKKYHSDLARIPWDVTGANLFSSRKDNPLRAAKRGLKKFLRIIQNRPAITRNWEVQFLNKKGKQGLESRLLTKGLKIHEFTESALILKLLEEVQSHPDAGNGYAVSQLLTFSTALEKNYT